MGAENSILEGCQWDDPLQSPQSFQWQLSPVTNTDGTEATVFEPKLKEGKDAYLLQKSAQILRTLRHPNIVRFIGCSETSSNVWLATESVVPMVFVCHELTSQELCVGLHDVLHGLDFLHSKLGMSHNNLCLPTIFVSPDGTWKLGGFEHACKFSDATQEYLERCRAYRKEDTLSPEEKAGKVSVDGNYGHARDVFAFGCLVESALDLVKEKDDHLKSIEHQMSVCASPDPSTRPKVSALLKLSIFSLDLIDILNFLKQVAIKSDSEKKEFFSTLLPRLQALPEVVIARRLVVPLLARFVLLNEWAEKLVLPNLLVPKSESEGYKPSIQGLLSESVYKEYVIKHLFNIFHVHDSHIRLILLQHFSYFAHLFSIEQLHDDIFIQILLGIRDSNDLIVASSLRALADLVPLLGGDFVIGGKRKPFFFHGLPKRITAEDIARMDIPKNMTSALSSHKPLLKDLAMAKKISSVENNVVAKENKTKEKELRREEARLKREERRKKLKEKNEHESVDNHTEENHISKGLTIEEAANQLNVKNVSDLSSNGYNNGVSESSFVTAQSEKSEDIGDDESSEWSDWEDNNIERKIVKDIKTELESIVHTVTPKAQTSPSPYQNKTAPSPPPVKVDWSDAPTSDTSENSKNLRTTKGNRKLLLSTKTKKEELKGDVSSLEEWGMANWEDKTTPNVKSAQKPRESISKSVTRPHKKQTDDLGMGLDIKSIDIKSKSLPPELDFFADMAPAILKKPLELTFNHPSSPNEDNLPLSSPKAKDKRKTNTKSSVFAVASGPNEDVAGWEETSWTNDDF